MSSPIRILVIIKIVVGTVLYDIIHPQIPESSALDMIKLLDDFQSLILDRARLKAEPYTVDIHATVSLLTNNQNMLIKSVFQMKSIKKTPIILQKTSA